VEIPVKFIKGLLLNNTADSVATLELFLLGEEIARKSEINRISHWIKLSPEMATLATVIFAFLQEYCSSVASFVTKLRAHLAD
jgi:hypothetical protein